MNGNLSYKIELTLSARTVRRRWLIGIVTVLTGLALGLVWLSSPAYADDPALPDSGQVLGSSPSHAVALGGNLGPVGGERGPMGGVRVLKHGRWASAMSADGQVTLSGEGLHVDEERFFALQGATRIPEAPTWATAAGQGHWLSASPSAAEALRPRTISFDYLGDEVPPGAENWLHTCFPDGTRWEQLPTQLDTYVNVASASTRGPGLSTSVPSLEIPLYRAGWNLFAYPVQETRPVSEALNSIEGYYKTVYGYVVTDTLDPWKVYGIVDGEPAPDWVNDLKALRFGQGYWINVTEPITLTLEGDTASQTAAASSVPQPPATYYGAVLASTGFTPTVGMTVTAWVEGNVCAWTKTQTQTLDGPEELVFVVDVPAQDVGATGCGAPGRMVSFEIESRGIVYKALWNNDRVWKLPSPQVYLPLMLRQHSRAPDLVVTRITATTNNIQVVIANQGGTPVSDAFWVDAYINPRRPPQAVNEIWSDLGEQGLVWGVTSTVQAGQALTLTVGDAYYWADYSQVSWPLPVTSQIYAQVDSAYIDTSYGSVLESHEITGGAYNNISGPVGVGSGVTGVTPSLRTPWDAAGELPTRP